jgi:hypothetical protein
MMTAMSGSETMAGLTAGLVVPSGDIVNETVTAIHTEDVTTL